MDPVSVTLSITALLTLTKQVVFYVKETKDATDERKRFIKEASSLSGMLTTLVDFVNDCDPEQSWFQAIQDLACENGPLDQYLLALQELMAHLSPGNRARKLGRTLLWKRAKDDIVSLLSQIERVQVLVELRALHDPVFVIMIMKRSKSIGHDQAFELDRSDLNCGL